MRGLIVLLVVVNLLIALWWWVGRPVDPPAQAPALDASPLVLLNEIAAELHVNKDHREPALLPGAFAPASQPQCRTLGPLFDRDLAMAARVRMEAVGLMAVPRAEDASQRLGFRVHTPPQADRPQADQLVERLRRAGIRDFFVVADGEFRHSVSLGVFSQEQGAASHADRLRGLGFEVAIGERRRAITAWWLDFAVPAGGSAAGQRLEEIRQAGAEVLVVQPHPCD